MNKQINTLIFDCFGVICDPIFNAWYRDNMLKRGLKDDNLLNVFEQHDLGKFSEDDVITYFSKLEGITATKDKIREEIDGYVKLSEDLAEVILKLKNRGFKTMLLSNAGTYIFNDKIYVKYPQFKGLFEEIVISSDIGLVKPNSDIYLHALKKIKSAPGESLFIDDSQVNVDAATILGIEGFLYTDVKSFLDYLKTIDINLDL
jgi:HAD superfamily hydrolase (TIGR01509 family)